jgi:hypothetical protein
MEGDINSRRMGWAGHITRMEDERITKRRFLMGNLIIQNSRT